MKSLKENNIYKLPSKTERKYYKYFYTTFSQPTLNSNGTHAVDTLAVKEAWTNGGYRPYVSGRTGDGTTAWYAFHTTSDYTAPYATGFGDDGERSGWYYLWMYSKNQLKATNLSFYFPGLDSDNDWAGAFRYLKVKASNNWDCWNDYDHSSWTQLYNEDAGSNTNVCTRGGSTTKSISNSNYYNYYLICCGTQGGGHRDGLTICSVKFTGTTREARESTSSDYDFYKDITIYYGIN